MKVTVIGRTVMNTAMDVPWEPDKANIEGHLNDFHGFEGLIYEGQALAEFAGRACYQSWSKPNAKTASNQGYLANIVRTGHFSVLEHASVTFYLTGVSRSFTHELVRHRHLSYSQLSQRYVDESDTLFVVPPVIDPGSDAEFTFDSAMQKALSAYTELADDLKRQFPDKPRKEIRQAARAVLPNATETKIVVTGNYRAWWEFLLLRATVHADVEIRAVAIAILRELQTEAPYIFNHFEISWLEDGTEVANLISK